MLLLVVRWLLGYHRLWVRVSNLPESQAYRRWYGGPWEKWMGRAGYPDQWRPVFTMIPRSVLVTTFSYRILGTEEHPPFDFREPRWWSTPWTGVPAWISFVSNCTAGAWVVNVLQVVVLGVPLTDLQLNLFTVEFNLWLLSTVVGISWVRQARIVYRMKRRLGVGDVGPACLRPIDY